MSGDWRGKFYDRQTVASKLGLIEAPKRETVSHEMEAARALEQKEIAYARALDRRIAEEIREAQRQRTVAELKALIDKFGREAVVAISRRDDPNFQLPVELQDEGNE